MRTAGLSIEPSDSDDVATRDQDQGLTIDVIDGGEPDDLGRRKVGVDVEEPAMTRQVTQALVKSNERRTIGRLDRAEQDRRPVTQSDRAGQGAVGLGSHRTASLTWERSIGPWLTLKRGTDWRP